MNYYNEIKNKLIENEVYTIVKDVCDGKISNEEFAKWVDSQDK